MESLGHFSYIFSRQCVGGCVASEKAKIWKFDEGLLLISKKIYDSFWKDDTRNNTKWKWRIWSWWLYNDNYDNDDDDNDNDADNDDDAGCDAGAWLAIADQDSGPGRTNQ